MIEIDKDVPLPKAHSGLNSCSKYPWREMELGDSFFVRNGRTQLTSSVPKNLKAEGWKFSSRKVEGGVRIWRIK